MTQADVAYNNDDDDGNYYPDYLDDAGWDNGSLQENDLVQVSLSDLKPMVSDPTDGKYLLFYDPQAIRVWNSQDKWDFIRPHGWDETMNIDGNTLPMGIEYSGQSDLWVEGININPGQTSISLVWASELAGIQHFHWDVKSN
ncbi:MAG: hypothetical protein R3C05_12530 [Pirellulaceae bacterium]